MCTSNPELFWCKMQALDETKTESAHRSPPRLIFTVNEDGSVRAAVAADGLQVDCPMSTTIFSYMLNVLGAYYARDLAYPRAYQSLAFLQTHVLKDDTEKVFKSSAFTKLENH